MISRLEQVRRQAVVDGRDDVRLWLQCRGENCPAASELCHQKRKTALWLRSKWIKPTTTFACAMMHAKKASSPRIKFAPAAHPRQDAAVLATVKVRSIVIAQYELMSARRPTLTAPARGGPTNAGPGRMNACGAAEPKKPTIVPTISRMPVMDDKKSANYP